MVNEEILYAKLNGEDIISYGKAGDVEIPIGINIKNLTNKAELEKAVSILNIKKKYQKIIDDIKSKYSPYELESFVDQRNEWRIYKQDPTSITPFVDAIAKARGITREILFEKIEKKVLSIATLQGLQKLEEQKL